MGRGRCRRGEIAKEVRVGGYEKGGFCWTRIEGSSTMCAPAASAASFLCCCRGEPFLEFALLPDPADDGDLTKAAPWGEANKEGEPGGGLSEAEPWLGRGEALLLGSADPTGLVEFLSEAVGARGNEIT